MALTELYSGTEAISTTEWSLTTDSAGPDADTTDGIFQVFLDLSDMIAGDVLQIRLYEKCRSGDTQRLAQEWVVSGAQASPLWIAGTFLLLHGWDVTLLAIAGTITVLWSIRDSTNVDQNVAAIKAKTDQLIFTKSNELDANIQSVNDVTVNGVGSVGVPWGP